MRITMPRRLRRRSGFTLLELMVVILIIGILAAFAVPQYMKSLENNKLDDAASMVNMIGTTNRMYALDHGGTYTSGTLTNACNTSTTCPDSTACGLIACKYLAPTDWSSKPYNFASAANSTCLLGTGVACASRKQSGTGSTLRTPYTNWGVSVDATGVFSTQGGAPMPTQ